MECNHYRSFFVISNGFRNIFPTIVNNAVGIVDYFNLLVCKSSTTKTYNIDATISNWISSGNDIRWYVFAETATAGEWQGKTLREQAQARGYQLVSDTASLNSVTEANQQKPLLGLFADGNMPVRWQGPKATYHGNIDKPAVTCTPNP